MMLPEDYQRLLTRAEDLRESFLNGEPFPHCVIDDFFPTNVYTVMKEYFPCPSDAIWKKPENIHTRGKMVTKRGSSSIKESQLSEGLRRTYFEFNSSLFLHFLSKLTGISNIVGDPYFFEGGVHCSEDGGFLDIHADFSHHDLLGLQRRLNVLLYLNDDWSNEYGGNLKLYDEQLVPKIDIAPIGNRCVIFATSKLSYHGHPEPMSLPPGVYRKSLAFYYYSMPQSDEKFRIIFPENPTFTHAPTEE